MKKVAKYITDFLLIIVVLAIFFALYGFSQLLIFQKDYANYFGYSMFEVVTGSMAPTININDAIIVKITDDIKVNDIVTYSLNGDFITHRIIDMKGNKIVTKGDYNNSEDKIIDKSEVIGKVVKVLPKLGVWKEIILSPTVIIIFLVASVLFSIAFSYKSNKEIIKDDDVLDFDFFNESDDKEDDVMMNTSEDKLMKKLSDILDSEEKGNDDLW